MNPYAALEQVVSTFMNIVAHKEQFLPKVLNESGIMEYARGIFSSKK